MGESGFPTPFSCSITAALLASLIAGADGYNGVMANFHLDLYVWMYRNSREKPGQARRALSASSLGMSPGSRFHPRPIP